MKYKLTTESNLNDWEDFARQEVSIRIKISERTVTSI